MRILLLVFTILIFCFLAVQLFAKKGQKNIETYPYKVLKQYKSFEVRSYESSLFTKVKMESGKYGESSRSGFSILAGYIFGGNESEQSIAMTSPVVMTLEDSMTMMFMVPKEFNSSTLPKPNSDKVKFHNEPQKIMAAIRFGGWADDNKIEAHKTKLIEALKKERIEHSNQFSFFGYNPPYEMSNRRNEVVVELINYSMEE